MNIELTRNYSSYYLKIEADNVKIEEDITTVNYAIKEDGKKDFSRRLGYDISDEWFGNMTRLMEDIAYYREKEFDSRDLIIQLFAKFPEESRQNLVSELERMI